MRFKVKFNRDEICDICDQIESDCKCLYCNSDYSGEKCSHITVKVCCDDCGQVWY